MKFAFPVRYVAWPLAVALVALPVVGLMRGWFAAGRWPIRTLQVQAPYRHVSAAEIRATVQPYLGKGFFATRLDRVQQAVAALPWVASAEARKVWPDTLELRVYERQPVAHWNGERLIDRQGRVFSAPGAADIGALPQLSGPDNREPDVVAFFQKVYAQFRSDGLVVVGVDLSGRDSWRLQLSDGAEVVVGNTDPEQRLQRFLDVFPGLDADKTHHFTRVDLRYANGFAVRWAESQRPATAQPATAPGDRTGKGHDAGAKHASVQDAQHPVAAARNRERGPGRFAGDPVPGSGHVSISAPPLLLVARAYRFLRGPRGGRGQAAIANSGGSPPT